MTRRVGLSVRSLLVPLLALSTGPACVCDDVDQFLPQGSIEPTVLDLGPVTAGKTCPATLAVKNGGNADLDVSGATLPAKDGDFVINQVPSLVKLGASENMLINYTASDTVGAREGTTVELVTNDRDNDGVLTAAITAFVAEAPVALARPECATADSGNEDDDGDGIDSPCTNLSFGSVLIGDPLVPPEGRSGRNLTVQIVNDGNSDLTVQAAVLAGPGAGEFQVVGARRGSQQFEFPVVVPAGRVGDCGDPTGFDNVLLVDVRFAPLTLGAAVATLQVLTTGAEGDLIDVALTGLGADTGLLTNPEVVRFSGVAEGDSATEIVLVQNIGTSPATVNTSCIDLEDDGTCDGNCTADENDVTLGGTLSCEVKKSDGAHDGKGFVMDASDARAGGDDERTVEIHWSPSAAQPAIPTTAVLRLESNIAGGQVFKVGIDGGNAGILEVSSLSTCGDAECLQAAGDPATVQTWTGSIDLILENTGSATLTIEGIDFEEGTGPTIADDWTIGAPGTTTLTAGAQTTVTLTYANLDCRTDPCQAIDASGDDGINLIVDHNGVLGETLVQVNVVPPQ